jgi:dTDP-glucose pyrophosphorylase
MLDLNVIRLHVSGRLVDAMWAIDKGGVEIALVTDDQGHLLGTVTDGDIRRAILNGASLQSPLEPHIHRNFTAVDPRAGRAEVLDLMQARTITQIPILDDQGRLAGLHLLHEMLGAVERPNWAVVMAGGKGTRLKPLTDEMPKPMIRVAGRPILERIVLHLVSFGIRRIFLSINYLGHVIEDHFGDGQRFGCRIDYLKEDRPLGTGGALSLLPEPPAHPVLVMNGDLVTQANLASMVEYHESARPCATVGVRRYFHTVPFGCVEVDGPRIVHLEEKPRLTRLVNAGIYVLGPQLLARVPKNQDFPLTALIEQCVAAGEPVLAFEIEDDWIDVGQRDQLHRARNGEA